MVFTGSQDFHLSLFLSPISPCLLSALTISCEHRYQSGFKFPVWSFQLPSLIESGAHPSSASLNCVSCLFLVCCFFSSLARYNALGKRSCDKQVFGHVGGGKLLWFHSLMVSSVPALPASLPTLQMARDGYGWDFSSFLLGSGKYPIAWALVKCFFWGQACFEWTECSGVFLNFFYFLLPMPQKEGVS